MDRDDRQFARGLEPPRRSGFGARFLDHRSGADVGDQVVGRRVRCRSPTKVPVETLPGGSVQPGDLIFFQKAGMVQRLVRWADDLWRHVGIVIKIDGHLWVVEAGRQGYRGRPLSTVLRTYSVSSVSRLAPCGQGCARRLVEAALIAMDEPTTYPNRFELALAGLLSLARRTAGSNAGRWGSMARWVAERYLERRQGEDPRTLCAALVVRSLGQVCGQHQRFPNLGAAKDESANLAFPDRLAIHFALPDDVWRLFESSQQYWVDNDLGGHAPQRDRDVG